MPQVTVTGGANAAPIPLQYSAQDIAYQTAVSLAATVDTTYGSSTPIVYSGTPVQTAPAHGGYLIIPDSQSGASFIDARGFGAITIQNTSAGDTVLGGANVGGQTVLASDGGLTFRATRGDTTVVAGGGSNLISFDAGGGIGNTSNTGNNAVYTSTGNDTIYGGDGNTTISAGGGDNMIYTEGGASTVDVTGQDSIKMGIGADTINVMAGGSAYVRGGAFAGSGFSLTFMGGDLASTVNGGGGSFDINGGAGGGFFKGGNYGNNSITGGSGNATIFGGGAGDTLNAGSGNDFIRAGKGNETLGGGSGVDQFQLYDLKNGPMDTVGGYTNGITITINDFTSQDSIKLIGMNPTQPISYALSTYTVTNGSGSFLLDDGTKVVLTGFSGPLTSSELK